MININLTTEEARNIGSWARNIIKSLQSKLKDMPIIKKKAEIILMQDEQRNKDESGNFLDFLTNFIEHGEGVRQAEKFIKNYDEEVKKVEFDLNSWLVLEEQIKNQIINETTSDKNSKSKSGGSTSESDDLQNANDY